VREITYKTNKIISEMYDLGIPVILMGYCLGKAQLLTKLFSHWEPIMHGSVARINSVYSELGVEIAGAVTHRQAEETGLMSKNRPWVMVAPLMSERNTFVQEMKVRYGAVTIGFSGWAVRSRYRYMMGLDYAMPLSDHCDYNELVNAVEQCNPDRILTFHGFAKEFAKSLTEMGFDAEPVGHRSTSEQILSLDSFQ
jgi:putative mRNA 3-end processing factor